MTPSFLAGSLDWLKGFLQSIMSPEDFEKHKAVLTLLLRKRRFRLRCNWTTKLRNGAVSWRRLIERERVLVSDLEAKHEKHTRL